MSARLFINLDTGGVQTDRSFPQNIGDVINSVRGGIRGRLNEQKVIEIGFTRSGAANTVQMTTPALDIILKRDSGTQKYDAAQLNSAVTFTEFNETGTNGETDYFYRGTLDLSQPVFAKLLGVDVGAAREQVAFQCVANVDDSLDCTYLTINLANGSFYYVLFYSSSTPEVAATHAPSGAAGGNIVSIGSNATAEAVATALEGASASAWTRSRDVETVTFTAPTFGAQGWHSPGTTGFEMTLITAGSAPGVVTDVESVSLLAELNWEKSGDVQISELFTFTLQNSLRRAGLSAAGVSPGRVRSGTVTITSGTATGTVNFSTPHSASDWAFDGAPTVEYVGGGTPDALAVATLKKTAATGFTYYLTGTAPDSDYRLSYRTIR